MNHDSSFLELIKTARFPLICLVVFAHSLGFSFDSVAFMDFSKENTYHLITQMISHNYAKIAVCLFFFFSGYLFFRNIDSFSWNWCLKKWKNRIHTLLIPFVSWNLITVSAIAAKNLIFSLSGQYSQEEMSIITNGSFLNWFRIPADFPLWYMEDLIFMSLITPVLFFLIKKLHTWSLVLMLLMYASPWEPVHVSMRAIFFFSLGAYCSIWKVDVLRICQNTKIPCHILAVITLLAVTFYNGTPRHEWYIRAFYPFGMISLLNIIYSVCSKRKTISTTLQSLSAYVFFIYAAHEIYILGWTKGICLRLMGESLPAMYARYFLVPIIVLIVCVLLKNVLDKFIPKSLAFVCGGR